jgi:hypothetical protein
LPSLVDDCPEAEAWIDTAVAAHQATGIYGRLAGSVVWSDHHGADGKAILPLDPAELVAKINVEAFPLLHEHDPGRPIGKVLEAAHFKTRTGQRFVAAILGFYDPSSLHSFAALGLDGNPLGDVPAILPALPTDFRITLAADPREVSAATMAVIVEGLEAPIEFEERSHNAADAVSQLIVIGLPFALLVWNPLITTLGQEAGKDLYKQGRKALLSILERVSILDNPLVEIQSFQHGCFVSFLIRGREEGMHVAANAALPEATARAHKLIESVIEAGEKPVRLVYEYNRVSARWSASFLELADGRLVSDTLALIAAELLPTGLSLGLTIATRLTED